MTATQIDLIFIVFMVIVISSMIYRLSNRTLVIASMLGLGTFWVYKSTERNVKRVNTPARRSTRVEVAKPTKPIYEEAEPLDNQLQTALTNAEETYQDIACPGDTALTARMLENGKKAKISLVNRSKFDKYSLLHYFDEELRTTENSIWWEDDSLEHVF